MISRTRFTAAALAAVITLTACGGSEDGGSDSAEAPTAEQPADAAAGGVRVVSAEEAAATIEADPDGLVILDVRTPEEFGEGHIDGAILIDFYRDDFADELAKLDRDVPYVLYCRSGNRSEQARTMMTNLGFTSVEDVEGGVIGWQAAGLPLVTG